MERPDLVLSNFMEDNIGFKMVKMFGKSTNWTPLGRHLQFDWPEREVFEGMLSISYRVK